MRTAKDLYDELVDLKQRIHEFHSRTDNEVRTEEDDVDFAFFEREASAICEDLRKECGHRMKVIARRVGMGILAQILSGRREDYTVKGKFCSGTADMWYEAQPPKQDSEDYHHLLKHLGIEAKDPEKVLKVDYKKLAEVVTQKASLGATLPGVGKVWPEYSLNLRRRSNVDVSTRKSIEPVDGSSF